MFTASLIMITGPANAEPREEPLKIAATPGAWSAQPAIRYVSVARWKAAEPAPKSEVRISHRSKRSGNHRGYATTEECIKAVENGGSYERGSNPTHTGRYQFSRSTWIANGGDPATWESASPPEQDAVFAATVARNGYRDWTPYDGCG